MGRGGRAETGEAKEVASGTVRYGAVQVGTVTAAAQREEEASRQGKAR